MKTLLLLYLSIFLLISSNIYSQSNGDTPWSNCFGKNASCDSYGCSEIRVITSANDPVVAIVKKNNKIIKHAYISANSRYSFEVKNGTYQVFFYYGTDWNSRLWMPSDKCGQVVGRWSSNEYVSKDEPITLKNEWMEYRLSLITNGNFTPGKSSLKEAF